MQKVLSPRAKQLAAHYASERARRSGRVREDTSSEDDAAVAEERTPPPVACRFHDDADANDASDDAPDPFDDFDEYPFDGSDDARDEYESDGAPHSPDSPDSHAHGEIDDAPDAPDDSPDAPDDASEEFDPFDVRDLGEPLHDDDEEDVSYSDGLSSDTSAFSSAAPSEDEAAHRADAPSDDDVNIWPRRDFDPDLDADLVDVLRRGGVAPKTAREYKRKRAIYWQTFCDTFDVDAEYPSAATCANFCHITMLERSVSPSSMDSIRNACSKLQRKKKDGVAFDNPWTSKIVKDVITYARRSRSGRNVPKHVPETREAIRAYDAFRMVKSGLRLATGLNDQLKSHHGRASAVDRKSVHLLRALLCCAIGFAFGTRATALIHTKLDAIKAYDQGKLLINPAWDDMESLESMRSMSQKVATLEYKLSHDKVYGPVELAHDPTRTMGRSEFAGHLHMLVSLYLEIRLGYFSLLVDRKHLKRTNAIVFQHAGQVRYTASSSYSHYKRLEILKGRPEEGEYLFVFPDEKVPKDGSSRVGAYLKESLEHVHAAPPRHGMKFSAHSLRSGGASALMLYTRSLPIVRYWFRWSPESKIPEKCYLQFTPTARMQDVTYAKYFFKFFAHAVWAPDAEDESRRAASRRRSYHRRR